ncbi:hypothetical protein J3F84DRAFT_277794 [Trichoderma pleuroticola]
MYFFFFFGSLCAYWYWCWCWHPTIEGREQSLESLLFYLVLRCAALLCFKAHALLGENKPRRGAFKQPGWCMFQAGNSSHRAFPSGVRQNATPHPIPFHLIAQTSASLDSPHRNLPVTDLRSISFFQWFDFVLLLETSCGRAQPPTAARIDGNHGCRPDNYLKGFLLCSHTPPFLDAKTRQSLPHQHGQGRESRANRPPSAASLPR